MYYRQLTENALLGKIGPILVEHNIGNT